MFLLNSMPHGVDIANNWLRSGTNLPKNTKTKKTSSSPRWTLQLTKLKMSKFNHSLHLNTSRMERSSTTKVAEPLKISRSSSTPMEHHKTAEPTSPNLPTMKSFPQSQKTRKMYLNPNQPKMNSRQLFKDFLGDFLNFGCVVGMWVV